MKEHNKGLQNSNSDNARRVIELEQELEVSLIPLNTDNIILIIITTK